METMTRQQAMAAGKSKYFTGKACSHGHISERYTASGACAACVSVAAAKNRANFTPEDGRKARKIARDLLEPIRLRILDTEAEALLGYAVAVTVARFPGVKASDVRQKYVGKSIAGYGLYTVNVHPDDAPGLRALAKAMLDAHTVDGAAVAAEVPARAQALKPPRENNIPNESWR